MTDEPLSFGGGKLLRPGADLRVNIVQLFGNWFGITAFLDAGDVAAPSSNGNLEAVLAPSATNPGGICGNGQTPHFSSSVQFSKPVTVYEFKNQDTVSLNLRVQRNF